MNGVRDIGRWKGSLLAKYALASYWYFRVILEDRSPGLTYALQGEEVPFISCWDITSVLDIGRGRRNSCKWEQFVWKKPLCFHQGIPLKQSLPLHACKEVDNGLLRVVLWKPACLYLGKGEVFSPRTCWSIPRKRRIS